MTNTTISNVFYTVANAGASTNAFVDLFATRDPTSNDTQYPVQKKWLNTLSGNYFMLEGFSSLVGVVHAVWIKIGGTSNDQSLTGNTGGAVFPTSSNINMVGDGTYITVAGNPVTSTLTIEPAGGLATLYTENTGTAVPSAGNLNIVGGTGVSTVGSGNTVTINAGTSVPLTFDANTGSATPALNVLNIL